MSKDQNGGPAFPGDSDGYRGMSLRDYFAGQALAGIYASGSHRDVASAIQDEGVALTAIELGHFSEMRIADMAYAMADAMCAERDK